MIGFTAADVFLVTGASSGLGAGVALKLNALGAAVVASARDADRLAATRREAAREAPFHLEPKDLIDDPDGLPGWLKTLKDRYGRLRGLIHCAGVSRTEPVRLLDYQGLKSLFDLNFFSALLLAKGFTDRRVNAGPGASVVMFSSIAAVQPARGQAAYGASKAALAVAVKALAREMAPQGLRANCIAPAMIKTPMTEDYLRQYGGDSAQAAYPLGLGEAEDAANLAVFLASDAARWITGQNYVLDGGAY